MKNIRKLRKKLSKRKQELKTAREKAALARYEQKCAENIADFYKRRFREFGSNVKTIDEKGPIKLIEWKIENSVYGNYAPADLDDMSKEEQEELKEVLIADMVRQLVENNIVQVIKKRPDKNNPLERYGALAVKMFVVPWDQMPHEMTMKIQKYIKNVQTVLNKKEE